MTSAKKKRWPWLFIRHACPGQPYAEAPRYIELRLFSGVRGPRSSRHGSQLPISGECRPSGHDVAWSAQCGEGRAVDGIAAAWTQEMGSSAVDPSSPSSWLAPIRPPNLSIFAHGLERHGCTWPCSKRGSGRASGEPQSSRQTLTSCAGFVRHSCWFVPSSSSILPLLTALIFWGKFG